MWVQAVFHQAQTQIAQYSREEIIEVVSNPAGQQPERFQFAQLDAFFFSFFPIRDIKKHAIDLLNGAIRITDDLRPYLYPDNLPPPSW
jgi:hypothetical protein